MKKYIIALLLITISHLMIASSFSRKITGTVYYKDDNSVIPGVNIMVKGTTIGTITDVNGKYEINVPAGKNILVFSSIGFVTERINIKNRSVIDVKLSVETQKLEEVVVTELRPSQKRSFTYSSVKSVRKKDKSSLAGAPTYEGDYIPHNTEEYATIHENIFLEPSKNPLSTFSIDVDAASYSNIRRFLNHGQMPQKDVVRIEEMVNYFNYDYPQPKGDDPFSITTEIGECPWNKKHQLVHIGLQGKKIPTDNLPPSNLVFLIDVSGSMSAANKLPLLKSSFKMLISQLREQDKVAIVVYAGAAGVVLESTPGNKKEEIMAAFDQLQAGGSTAGGAGINLAYKIAKENFKEKGNNRIILATDGDFNVGASSNASMERLIEEKRKEGVFLTVLGYGMGNYKDSKMEVLADKGNGNYAYIDNIQEAKKVLVNEFGGTLFTIAKDVKLQVEFNPTQVQAYRLIGYENRKLKNEDFNNDKKDAGELGSGHTVTALYEVIPVGVSSKGFIQKVDDLKYQKVKEVSRKVTSNEILNLKLRYKKPNADQSKLIIKALMNEHTKLENTSDNFKFSAAVAAFGMILRASEFKGDYTLDNVVALANSAKGEDREGYRAEFVKMVRSCDLLASR